MRIRTTTDQPARLAVNWLCLGLLEAQPTSSDLAWLGTHAERIQALIAAKELPSGLGETTPIYGLSGLSADALLMVGLGSAEGFGPGAAFSAGVALAKRLAGKPRAGVAVVLPEPVCQSNVVTALVEGVIVGTRGQDLRKSERTRYPFEELILVARPEVEPLDASLRRGEIVGEAVNVARDLVNTPPAEKPPRLLAETARELGEAAGLAVTIWDEAKLREERFGGLLGVAAGSAEPPRFVILDWLKGGDAPTTALVGKGITFDSGGLSLKPSISMEDMKADMAGAATVLATMLAIARLGLPVNVRGYLPLAENMTGGHAYKLGDVLTMRNGKTVEVLNTDAEGRLILADALSYAAEQNPARLLDLATLTGACVVALGQKITGLFSNHEGFADEYLTACRTTGERAWRLPLDKDYRELLKSEVADLKNIGGKWGGASTAAKFLEEFVASLPWVHLDIAGPSWADSDSPSRDGGATGCHVRTLVTWLEREQGRF